MTRTSCISHKPNQQVVIIREDYLSVCDGNHCAAALLNVFEYWMTYKLNHREQAQTENKIAAAGNAPLVNDDLWVYKTAENLKDELLGLFADTKITAAIVILKAKGFITTRNNPNYGWDRTLQYLFNTEAVQHAVNISDAYTILKNKVSKPYKKRIKAVEISDGSLKNKEAIPETTTKVTSETTTENTIPAAIATGTPATNPIEEKTDVVKAAEEVINKLAPHSLNDLYQESVKIVFNLAFGGLNGRYINFLTGSPKNKGEWKEWQINDPPMTPGEIVGFADWYGTTYKKAWEENGKKPPMTPQTLNTRILEFRVQPNYQEYVNKAESAFMARMNTTHDDEPPKELPPPNADYAAKAEEIIQRLARGESINELISA